MRVFLRASGGVLDARRAGQKRADAGERRAHVVTVHDHVDHAMRFALDLAPPNSLLSAAFGTPALRWLARHIYFRVRGGQGVSFAVFEARLAGLQIKDGSAATGVFR